MELSREEKIKFLTSIGIDYKDNTLISLDELYRIGLSKKLISKRLNDSIDCFGYFDNDDIKCLKCFMHQNKRCDMYKDYIAHIKTGGNNPIKIGIHNLKGEQFKLEDLDALMQKIKYRENSLQYKIAKIILTANNCSYADLLAKIQDITGNNCKLNYAKVRFYQVRTHIEKVTGLKVEILTQKYIHLRKIN